MLALNAPAEPAIAQTQQQLDWCEGKNQPTPDLKITSCTAVIQSEKISPKEAVSAFNNRAIAYATKRLYDRAIADLDEAIRIDPNYARSFNNRGIVYTKKGQYARAIADFDRAVKLNTNYAVAFYNRGLAKQKKGDTSEGDADLERAKQIDPNIGQ
jgi:tetratricopeptide (TPR) repeat protein